MADAKVILQFGIWAARDGKREVPMPYAKNREQQVVVTTDRIVAAIRKVLNRS
jgi:hypothetical protein